MLRRHKRSPAARLRHRPRWHTASDSDTRRDRLSPLLARDTAHGGVAWRGAHAQGHEHPGPLAASSSFITFHITSSPLLTSHRHHSLSVATRTDVM